MNYNLRYPIRLIGILVFSFLYSITFAQDSSRIVTDVTQLDPIKVGRIIAPTTTSEIVTAVKNNKGPVSIGGGRYSMGGQTATENGLQLDMRRFDRVLHFSEKDKEITVQSGITWRKLLAFIDTAGLSVKIMQSYANFTVGGALSVNAHGRYVGWGPIILSVKKFSIVLANGEVVEASPVSHSDIFFGAIGGYGGLGVITDVTLSLTDNCRVERTDTLMQASEYKNYFFKNIRNDPAVIFHSADIYPNRYKMIHAVTHKVTARPVTDTNRLNRVADKYTFNRIGYSVVSGSPSGKWIRQHMLDPWLFRKNPVVYRNYEAGSNVEELEPRSRKRSTYVLEEYFVPVDNFDTFYPAMTRVLKRNYVNVINISIRNARQDPGTLLAWARTEVFSFVMYYKQGTTNADKQKVKQWTRELIDTVIAHKGTYYLPYQIHATPEQFAKAYPNSDKFFALKHQLDPANKFRNKLWDTYYKP